jgi:hypothetical protein
METITIPLKRYQELIRKEVGFDIRQAELREASFASTADKIIFSVETVQEDDDF